MEWGRPQGAKFGDGPSTLAYARPMETLPLGRSMRAEQLHTRELRRFAELHPASRRVYERAYSSMPDGVPSGVCVADPYPLVISHGMGAYAWDVDGREYVDYHNGFGTSVFGHAHPEIVEALTRQAELGTHFGALTEVAGRWAEHLCLRYRLEWVRFSTSGSEAVADAVRLARAAAGRTRLLKVEGCYHGSSEAAFVSNSFAHPARALEPGEMPRPKAESKGISPRVEDDVAVVPFNDLERTEMVLAKGDVAAVLLEPVLFNVGAIFPVEGYLAGLRALCDRYGSLLVFDEVKTGASLAYGGAAELFGVEPDIKVLGKGIGGGVSVGAVGACRDGLRRLVEDFDVPLLGTFSGNPLAAAAGEAALTRVLVPSAYAGLQAHYDLLEGELTSVIERFELPAYVIGAGAKGCVVWAGQERLVDFRDYCARFDGELADLLWVYLVNRGVFLAPGQDEQWTHSVAHGETEAGRFLEAFASFAEELRD